MAHLFRKKRKPAKTPWDLDAPLLSWAAGAPWSIGDSFQGTQVFGATGSGKTSGPMAAICRSLLGAGYGGLFLTAKRGDRDLYRGYVREAGRLADLQVLAPDSGMGYNFMAEELAQSPDPLTAVENLTAMLMSATELLDRRTSASGGGENETFFRRGSERLARNGLLVLALAGQGVSVPHLHRLVTSAPGSLDEVASEAWRRGSFCFQRLEAADRAKKTDAQRADFDTALTFFLQEWPTLSSRTRSAIEHTLTTATDLLSRGAARELLSSPVSNVSPSHAYGGGILIVDLPVLVHKEAGAMVQTLIKFAWQRSHARRDTARSPRPTFIVADESQLFAVEADEQFQSIARETRTAVVYATQSLSGMLAAFGGSHAEARVHSLLTNLQNKIVCQQTDSRTIEYLQAIVGKSPRLMMSGNQSRDGDWLAPLFGGPSGSSAGFSEVMDHELEAREMNCLAKGGPHRRVDAIVFQGGKRFPNGRTWMRASFRQHF